MFETRRSSSVLFARILYCSLLVLSWISTISARKWQSQNSTYDIRCFHRPPCAADDSFTCRVEGMWRPRISNVYYAVGLNQGKGGLGRVWATPRAAAKCTAGVHRTKLHSNGQISCLVINIQVFGGYIKFSMDQHLEPRPGHIFHLFILIYL